jgi:hypothetical protein
MSDAYLDIETTGLSSGYAGITVVGMYLASGADDRFVQPVGMNGGMPPVLPGEVNEVWLVLPNCARSGLSI